jgi:hypothetical protein
MCDREVKLRYQRLPVSFKRSCIGGSSIFPVTRSDAGGSIIFLVIGSDVGGSTEGGEQPGWIPSRAFNWV